MVPDGKKPTRKNGGSSTKPLRPFLTADSIAADSFAYYSTQKENCGFSMVEQKRDRASN